MADSFVPITAGTGTSIDTRTETDGGQHRQVIVLGDPSTTAGVAPVSATLGLSVDVTNSTLAATQSGTWNVGLSAGTNNIGDVDVLTLPTGQATMASSTPVVLSSNQSSIPVTGTFYQATQPVSASSLPLPSGASTSAKQDTVIGHLDGVEGLLTTIDGDTGLLSATVYTEGDVDTTITGVPVLWEDASNTLRTVSSAKPLPVDIQDASVTVTGTLTDAELRATPVPVSGTVTANLGTLNGAATSAKQDTLLTEVSDKLDEATFTGRLGEVQASPTANTVLDRLKTINTTLGGTLTVTGGGGGVEYTEGDIDTTITGSALMWEDGSDTLRAVSATKPLPVDITDSSVAVTGTFWQATQPVSGTVTANAGTNLNTSALALEAGNLATLAGAVRAEDVASGDGHTGVPALATRKATPANVSGTDGDYEFLQMSTGRLWTSATIDAALPAGTNAIGKLAANSGVDIGDVDVTSLPAIPTGTNTIGSVKLTDGTDVADILDLTNSNPLAVAITDATGDQITSFGGGTQYTEGDTDASITGTALLWEDAANTLATVSSSKPLPVDITDASVAVTGTFWQATQPVSLTSTTVTGTVAVTQSGTWDEVGINDSGNSITVDAPVGTPAFVRLSDGSAAISTLPVSLASVPSHAVTNAGTFATQVDGAALTALQLIDDPVATLGTTTYTEATTKGFTIGAVRRDADTTLVDTTNEIGPLQMNAAGQLKVEAFSGETLPVSLTSTTVTGTVAVTQSGTWSLSANQSVNQAQVAGTATDTNSGNKSAGTQRVVIATDQPALTNPLLTTSTAVGTIADDSTTPSAPVMIGGQAKESDGTDPGSVSAEDDVARAIFDRNRRQYVNTAHPNLWTANDNQSSAQTNTSLKTAPGANLSLYITDIYISNGATAGDVRFVEDPAGTPVIKVPKTYVAVNGGAVIHFATPIRITANKGFGYTSTTVTTHSVLVNGYVAP